MFKNDGKKLMPKYHVMHCTPVFDSELFCFAMCVISVAFHFPR